MSYLEDFTARRDYTQASAFYIARRFMHHTQLDPLAFDFPLPSYQPGESQPDKLPKNASDEAFRATSEKIETEKTERERVHWTVPVLHGFTGADLTVVQYGRMTAILERGLNTIQQRRWQALEAELVAPHIAVEYMSALMGHGNYSADEIKEVARQLNNPLIMASFDDVEAIERIARPIREEGELAPKRPIRLERVSNPLKSLYDALPEATETGEEIPEIARRIEDYIIAKLLPSEDGV